MENLGDRVDTQVDKQVGHGGERGEKLAEDWRSRLEQELPRQDETTRTSIGKWLLGANLEAFVDMDSRQWSIAKQAMNYRYRILKERYLGVSPTRCYQNLTGRLSSLVMLRNKIRTWVALSRDRQRAVVDVLQEVVQELLHSDRYIQKQILWIAECTQDPKLRDTLLLTTVEEYCLRPIRNQPLIVYRFVNFLRRSQRGGMTHIPAGEIIKLISEEVIGGDSDNPMNLWDEQAITFHQEEQAWEQQQSLRLTVQQEFENYLHEQLGEIAVQWLRRYLQGKTQDSIAQSLGLPIEQIYRLREKVSYHAIRVFAIKNQPELVTDWLEISLQEHSLGLTPQQWQEFTTSLNPDQQTILFKLQSGLNFEAIAQQHHLKIHQVVTEWGRIYLAAQEIRSS